MFRLDFALVLLLNLGRKNLCHLVNSVSKIQPNPYNSDLIIGVFNHGLDEVVNLDLSFLNVKFYKINSPEFKKLVDTFNYYFPIGDGTTNQREFSSTIYYRLQNERAGGFHPNLYALIPIDFSAFVSRDTFFDIESVLLILFPSDFQLDSLVHYDKEDRNKYSESFSVHYDAISYSYVKGGFEIPPCIDGTKIAGINQAIPLVYNFIKNATSFEIAVSSYVEAFKQRSAKMAYICYCIALEALVESSDGEITYKICRTTAVVNADKIPDGELSFSILSSFTTYDHVSSMAERSVF